ncbi:MAG: ImmA/IrrE family metallo-endopeptidase [Candidatus Moraniibacteriota bacterium]
MRIKRLHKNWDPMQEIFELTKNDIELQVMSDMQKYNGLYYAKYGKSAPDSLDVDNFVAEVWEFEIKFESIKQPKGEEILGCLRPQNREIIIDSEQCNSKERINFTIAHEAGHLSLHASMLRLEDGRVVGWKNKPIEPQFTNRERIKKLDINQTRMEWQANKYASALLAPKYKIYEILTSLGLITGQHQLTPIDLTVNSQLLMEKFGLSRQALEIRLSDLKVDVIGKKY